MLLIQHARGQIYEVVWEKRRLTGLHGAIVYYNTGIVKGFCGY
jgi:hypothetical protein